jgi:hypothetical protein
MQRLARSAISPALQALARARAAWRRLPRFAAVTANIREHSRRSIASRPRALAYARTHRLAAFAAFRA